MSRASSLTLEYVNSLLQTSGGKLPVLLAFCLVILVLVSSSAVLAGPVLTRSGGVLDTAERPKIPPPPPRDLQFQSVPSPSEVIEGATATDELLNGAPEAPELKLASHSESLEQVLRAMTNRGPRGHGAASPSGSRAPAADESDEVDQAVEQAYRALLENETLGALLQKAVHVEVGEDGRRTFDVLGIGRFEVGVSPDSGELTVTESSLGISVPLRVASNDGDEPAPATRQRETGMSLQGLLWRLVTLLDSTEWLLLSIVGAAILVPVGAVRIAIRANKRPPLRLVR